MANSLPSLTIFATQEIEPVHLRESQYKSLNQDRLLWRFAPFGTPLNKKFLRPMT